jgi:hypothetical protein
MIPRTAHLTDVAIGDMFRFRDTSKGIWVKSPETDGRTIVCIECDGDESLFGYEMPAPDGGRIVEVTGRIPTWTD